MTALGEKVTGSSGMDSSTSSSVTSLVLSFIANLVKGILAKLATPVKVNYSEKTDFLISTN